MTPLMHQNSHAVQESIHADLHSSSHCAAETGVLERVGPGPSELSSKYPHLYFQPRMNPCSSRKEPKWRCISGALDWQQEMDPRGLLTVQYSKCISQRWKPNTCWLSRNPAVKTLLPKAASAGSCCKTNTNQSSETHETSSSSSSSTSLAGGFISRLWTPCCLVEGVRGVDLLPVAAEHNNSNTNNDNINNDNINNSNNNKSKMVWTSAVRR